MKPYVIVSPDYNPVSGGIKVMWALYGYLLSKGVEVYMNKRPEVDCIAIYPEILHGNPVNTRYVVRYILNTPGVMGAVGADGTFTPGPTEFPATDMQYFFSQMFSRDQVHDNKLLFLPAIDLHTFKNTNQGKRDKVCYLVGKGQNKNIHPHDAIPLSRQFALNQGALAELLNECRVMYCYDDLTAMMECARLCGCPVLYYGSYSQEKLRNYEPGLDGIFFNKDSLTRFNVPDFRERYSGLIEQFQRKLNIFIEDTQS